MAKQLEWTPTYGGSYRAEGPMGAKLYCIKRKDDTYVLHNTDLQERAAIFATEVGAKRAAQAYVDAQVREWAGEDAPVEVETWGITNYLYDGAEFQTMDQALTCAKRLADLLESCDSTSDGTVIQILEMQNGWCTGTSLELKVRR